MNNHTPHGSAKGAAEEDRRLFQRINGLVDNRIIAKLNQTELRVLYVLQRFANSTTTLGWPSLKTIAFFADVQQSAVSAALKGLERKGAIRTLSKDEVVQRLRSPKASAVREICAVPSPSRMGTPPCLAGDPLPVQTGTPSPCGREYPPRLAGDKLRTNEGKELRIGTTGVNHRAGDGSSPLELCNSSIYDDTSLERLHDGAGTLPEQFEDSGVSFNNAANLIDRHGEAFARKLLKLFAFKRTCGEEVTAALATHLVKKAIRDKDAITFPKAIAKVRPAKGDEDDPAVDAYLRMVEREAKAQHREMATRLEARLSPVQLPPEPKYVHDPHGDDLITHNETDNWRGEV